MRDCEPGEPTGGERTLRGKRAHIAKIILTSHRAVVHAWESKLDAALLALVAVVLLIAVAVKLSHAGDIAQDQVVLGKRADPPEEDDQRVS